jgi:GNAT superfamily N-acetyltransferase
VVAALQTPHTLVTTYLHMTDRSQFAPSLVNDPSVKIIRMDKADVSFYRFLYSEVGKDYRWRDRLVISERELYEAISKPGVSVHVMYVDGVPAGYVELAKHGDETEVAYFGLRSEFHGNGYGKHLLSYGIDRAWRDGAKRVWVHTCNLDAPYAMSNYLKRGFQVYEVHESPMPSRYAS